MKLTFTFYKLLIFTSAFLLTHCFILPESIIKLKPGIEKTDWYKGKEIATIDNDSITIHISYDRNINQDYVFDVDVINNTQNPILIEPERFSYIMKKGSIKLGDALKPVHAKDPELVILDLQKSYSSHQSFVETQSMFYSLGYFLQFVGQTKALLTNDQELSNQLEHQTYRLEQEQLINDAQNRRISETLFASSNFWEIIALRKTTLHPNDSISGKVFFPVNELAKTIEFSFPIEGYELKIIYDQTSISPND